MIRNILKTRKITENDDVTTKKKRISYIYIYINSIFSFSYAIWYNLSNVLKASVEVKIVISVADCDFCCG